MEVFEKQLRKMVARDRTALTEFMASSGYTLEKVVAELAAVPRARVSFEQPFYHHYFREKVVVQDGVLVSCSGYDALYDFFSPVLVTKLYCARDLGRPDNTTLYFTLTYANWEDTFGIQTSEDLELATPSEYRKKEPAAYKVYQDLWTAFKDYRELCEYDSRKQ